MNEKKMKQWQLMIMHFIQVILMLAMLNISFRESGLDFWAFTSIVLCGQFLFYNIQNGICRYKNYKNACTDKKNNLNN